MLNGKQALIILGTAVLMLLAACKSGPSQQELFEKATVAQEKSDFSGAIAAYREFVLGVKMVYLTESICAFWSLPL